MTARQQAECTGDDEGTAFSPATATCGTSALDGGVCPLPYGKDGFTRSAAPGAMDASCAAASPWCALAGRLTVRVLSRCRGHRGPSPNFTPMTTPRPPSISRPASPRRDQEQTPGRDGGLRVGQDLADGRGAGDILGPDAGGPGHGAGYGG
jgi:hypothetical protein